MGANKREKKAAIKYQEKLMLVSRGRSNRKCKCTEYRHSTWIGSTEPKLGVKRQNGVRYLAYIKSPGNTDEPSINAVRYITACMETSCNRDILKANY